MVELTMLDSQPPGQQLWPVSSHVKMQQMKPLVDAWQVQQLFMHPSHGPPFCLGSKPLHPGWLQSYQSVL